MGAGRILAIAAMLAATPIAWAQSCMLSENAKAGDCSQIQIDMKLSGELRIRKDDKTVPLKLEASAQHKYPERILEVANGGVVKTARVYEIAKAVISAGDNHSERTLRPDHRLFVVQHFKDQGLVYSPAGALTREELSLVAEQFDSSVLGGVLPGKEVKVGETWKVPAKIVQILCNFEGLTEHSLNGKLESVKGETATFRLNGTANGIDLGAIAKLKIDAVGRFDVKTKRVVSLEWKQKDEREQGPASPASVSESTITLKRQAIEQPDSLSDVALVSVPADKQPPAPLLQLDYRDPWGRYALLHSRPWHLTSQSKEHLVMRYMERGDFVAQLTITPWKKAEKGKHISGEEFKQTMNNLAGWQPEKELQAGELPAENGRWIYRLSTQGQMDGVTAVQNFYLIATPEGEQWILVFTMTPKQVGKFGARDLSLIGSMEIPAPSK